jgi:hypothetical protein
MTNLKGLATAVLAANLFPALQAERPCPGNVDRLPLRQLQGALPVAAVTVNGSGCRDWSEYASG